MSDTDDYQVHFLAPLTVPISTSINSVHELLTYGDELTITSAVREAGLDRNGASWLDLVDEPDRQVTRWGSVVFRRGPWPDDLPRLEPGSEAWQDAREAARVEAHKVEDKVERAARLREVDAQFGPAPTSSRSLAHYDNGQIHD